MTGSAGARHRWGWTDETESTQVALRLEKLWFDRVEVREDSGTQSYGVAEFLELPLDHRLRWHFSGRLAFFRGADPVDTHDAMRSLMAAVR